MHLTNPVPADVAALRAVLSGRLVLPGDESWDADRQAWNLAVDQRPEMVALPESADDVRALVAFAKQRGLRILMQGTGHGAASVGPLAGTLLVRTSEMRGLHIDAEHRIARAEAGVLLADVVEAASELGLAPLSGSSPDVGVVGFTLGGGIGWLSRRYGLASERVLAIEVVTADGRLVRTDRRTEPELFWALRGGGGSFAAVTAIEFELVPLTRVYAGMMLWPWERAREVLHAWREWTATAPESVTTSARIMQIPAIPDVPEFLRGRGVVVIDGAALGDQFTAEGTLAPLRALEPEIDTFAMVPPAALCRIHMDPEHPVPGLGDHALLDALAPEAVDRLVDACGPGSGSPLLSVELRHAGGALARPGSGALGSLPGQYAMYAVGALMAPSMAGPIRVYQARAKAALAAGTSRRQYPNFADRPADPAAFYGEEVHARLMRVKAQLDPDDLFRGTHEIAVSGELAAAA
jgi:FAD binding domain/Berberine and berberine like